jgi:hypothetical protein
MDFYGQQTVYSESGVDLTLLRENLRHTIEERWRGNCRLLPLLDALRDAGGSRPERSRMAAFDPEALLRRLTDNQVEFVLVGGLAMIAHGSAYVTSDLDVCYGRTAQNLTALAAALAPLHPRLRGAPADLPFRLDSPTLQAGLNFTLPTDAGDLDLLGELAGIGGFAQALARSEERTVFGMTIRLLTLDGLIAAKKAAGRLKDRTHLLELEELKKLREAEQ